MITAGVGVEKARRGLNGHIVLAKYLEHGVVVEGHVDFGNGLHGNVFINPHALFRDWSEIWQDIQTMWEKLPTTLARDIQVVAGPLTGGAFIALWSPIVLDQLHAPADPRIQFAMIEMENGNAKMKPTYADVVKGKKVALVDDVRNTGRTFHTCAQAITKAGGELVVTLCLIDRKQVRPEFSLDVSHVSLTVYDVEDRLVPQDKCVDCQFGVPIMKF